MAPCSLLLSLGEGGNLDPGRVCKNKNETKWPRWFHDLILEFGPEIYDNKFLSWPKKVAYFWYSDKKKNRRRGGGGGEKTYKEKDENIWRANVEGSHERSWKVKKRVLKVKDITLSFDLSCRA